MEISVNANKYTADAIISDILVDGDFECYGLEPKYREVIGQPVESWKVDGLTAIPAGRYRLTMTYSPHFDKILPLVNSVPGYSGVRIHGGNVPANTEACLLTGEECGDDSVTASQDALKHLVGLISGAIARNEEVWITYNREGHP